MDIQNYINQNEDYLIKFKNMNLQLLKYNVLGLTLIKYNQKTIIDDFTKLFKSVIIDQKTNKVLSIAPMKSIKSNHSTNSNLIIKRIFIWTCYIKWLTQTNI